MSPERITQPDVMQQRAAAMRQQGLRIGLVPTMGYLHEGHLSLMRQLRPLVDRLLVSIFINPTQFGTGEDLERYPVDLERDKQLCAEVPVDLLFIPTVSAMYPDGYASYVEFNRYSDLLCGDSRPGHFRGVGTVVLKLFQLCQPHLAAFGCKDAQQLFLIKRMVADFNLPVEVVEGPTVREPDGLALSSRNSFLQGEQREQALALSRVLRALHTNIERGESDANNLQRRATEMLREYPGFELEYLAFHSWQTLAALTEVDYPMLIAIAGRVGGTRLIDNLILTGTEADREEWLQV